MTCLLRCEPAAGWVLCEPTTPKITVGERRSTTPAEHEQVSGTRESLWARVYPACSSSHRSDQVRDWMLDACHLTRGAWWRPSYEVSAAVESSWWLVLGPFHVVPGGFDESSFLLWLVSVLAGFGGAFAFSFVGVVWAGWWCFVGECGSGLPGALWVSEECVVVGVELGVAGDAEECE